MVSGLNTRSTESIHIQFRILFSPQQLTFQINLMKKIFELYIQYLERKRKSADLWKLMHEETINKKACIAVYNEAADENTKIFAIEELENTYTRVEKLKNLIKLL